VRDGSLSFKVEDGQVVAVLQNAGLDHFYERMFRNAYRRAHGSRRSIEAGINIVVFGTFWLEARANLFLRDALVLEAHSQAFGNALWSALRRSALLEKLELFHVLASTTLAAQYSEIKSGVKTLFDLRNRLAHFKDENILVGGPFAEAYDAVMFIRTAEDPELIKQLRAPAVIKHGQAALSAYHWMSRVQRSHAKTRGRHIKSRRLSRQRAEP
jgi:hypothetical protein